MTKKSLSNRSRRVSASDDLEVSAYLEIAKEKSGQHSSTSTSDHIHHEAIIIIDFGSQYSKLIARRIRETNVYCEIVSPDQNWESVSHLNPRGVILSGGPASVYDQDAPMAPTWVYDQRLPVLGICYGMQVMVHQLGGKVIPTTKREYGHAVLHHGGSSQLLFADLPSSIPVWMSHGDRISDSPPGFYPIAHTENSPIAAIADGNNMIGIQFHPEVVHTPDGKTIIDNFVHEICACGRFWTPANFVSDAVKDIKDKVEDGKVICALSGGVDSAVAASLVHEAVGDQLTCIFVNNGLMRKEEPERILKTFEDHLKVNLVYADATDQFLSALKGVIDPEEKRKVIGQEFIRVFEREAEALGKVDYLTQGTLYPDVIESKTDDNKISATIKTHHNVGGIPKDMKLTLLEPLRHLFKDEVREVGLELGLAEEMVYRQPFPGPGLAIRVMGEVLPEKLEVLREADWIVMDEIKNNNLYNQVWQSFAVLTDTRTVGVTGDHRTYGYVIAIRAVTSEEAMTADWARIPYEILARISNRIANEVLGVNRVVFDITSKPPGTIEWE